MYSPKDIEVIVSFKTPDGKVFDNLQDALFHEPTPLYRMWANSDEISEADNLSEAFYVYLPSAEAVSSFIHDSDMEGLPTDGICQVGWYCWDTDNLYFRTLSEGLGRLLLNL